MYHKESAALFCKFEIPVDFIYLLADLNRVVGVCLALFNLRQNFISAVVRHVFLIESAVEERLTRPFGIRIVSEHHQDIPRRTEDTERSWEFLFSRSFQFRSGCRA